MPHIHHEAIHVSIPGTHMCYFIRRKEGFCRCDQVEETELGDALSYPGGPRIREEDMMIKQGQKRWRMLSCWFSRRRKGSEAKVYRHPPEVIKEEEIDSFPPQVSKRNAVHLTPPGL
jgi:hypothetical protein